MFSKYSKAIVQLVGSFLVLLAPILTGGQLWSNQDWVNFAIAAVGVVIVWNATNFDATVAKYSKFIGAAVIAGLMVLVNVIPGGVTATEWWQIAFAVLASLGVLAVPTTARVRSIAS